jgi:Fur family ferric uptake transcriptional regulator
LTSAAVAPPDPVDDVDDALARVRASGGRVTRAKRAVVELVFDAPAAMTVEDLAARSGLELSVVYRTLSQFEELGIVEHVHLGHGGAAYRRRGLATVPVTCVGCGRTVDVGADDVGEFRHRIAELTGIELDVVHFPLSGRCAECRQRD